MKFKQGFRKPKVLSVGAKREQVPIVLGNERRHILTDREMAKMRGGKNAR